MLATKRQHMFELFGTGVRLLVSAAIPPPLCAHVSLANVEARLRGIHETLTRFDPSGELSQLNAHVGRVVRISPALLTGTVAAVRAAELSDGLASAPAFAIDAGGDIRIGGTVRRPRAVEIERPFETGAVHRLSVTAGALATGGLGTRIWRTARGYAHRLIDLHSATPACNDVIQATAHAPTALEAETLAKTAVLRGQLAGRATLRRYGGALVLDTGKFIAVEPSAHARAIQRHDRVNAL
jgi:thiamine biosynthesis lipoprotein ApbE